MANAFKNLHDVTLQRLNVYHKNNGHRVYYDAQHFASTVNAWNGVPVIYTETNPGAGAEHPTFADVSAGTPLIIFGSDPEPVQTRKPRRVIRLDEEDRHL